MNEQGAAPGPGPAGRDAADLVRLARAALARPGAEADARALLEEARSRARRPAEHLAVAEAALEAGDPATADALYAEAEAGARGAADLAALALSLAAHRGAGPRAAGLLRAAAGAVEDPRDRIRLARAAQDGPGDRALAEQLLAPVDASLASLDDALDLTRELAAAGEHAEARLLCERAAARWGDLRSIRACARVLVEALGDRDRARRLLEGADCQFPGDCIALASGYREILGDQARVAALLDEAEELAMTGEEHLAVAEGVLDLTGDGPRAARACARALGDLSDPGTLGTLTRLAEASGDRDLVRRAYERRLELSRTAAEHVDLAAELRAHSGDREGIARIYTRAEETCHGVEALLALARGVREHLEDRAWAARLTREAVQAGTRVPELLAVADAAAGELEDAALAGEALAAALPRAARAGEALRIARSARRLGEQDLVAAGLDAAELLAVGRGEMAAVAEAAGELTPEDPNRHARARARLAARDADEPRYGALEAAERAVEGFHGRLALATRVMAELGDQLFARRLLQGAAPLVEADGFDPHRQRALLLAVGRHLGDAAWVRRLADAWAAQADDSARLGALCRALCRALPDAALGRELARGYLAARQTALDADPDPCAPARLAGIVLDSLGDRDWAGQLLEAAEGRAQDHLALAHLGALHGAIGDPARAEALYRRAAAACDSSRALAQLMERLRADGAAPGLLRALYAEAGARLEAPLERLRWAEGILHLFDDDTWAASAYEDLEAPLAAAGAGAAWQASRRTHLGGGLRHP